MKQPRLDRETLQPAVPAAEPMEARPHRLLIVDDNEMVARLACRVAESRGWTAEAVHDVESFRAVLGRPFDAMLLDLVLPDGSGVDLIRSLAASGSRPALLLWSGYDLNVLRMAREIASARGLNVLGTLEKPPDWEFFGLRLDLAASQLAPNAPASGPRRPASQITRQDLEKAIADKRIYPLFQPKVSLRTGRLVAVESLARWTLANGTPVPPSEFIPLAERGGLIDDLTSLLFDRSLQSARAWLEAGRNIPLSVNICASSLRDTSLPVRLVHAVERHGLVPEALTLEITESALVDDVAESLETLLQLYLAGFRLSIDDFGTGYSTLLQLARVPFHEIKIDRSFVGRMLEDEEARIITQNTVDLGRRLGLVTVAEGVESWRVWNSVRDLDCDLAQGFLMGRATSAEKILDWQLPREIEVQEMACRRLPAGRGGEPKPFESPVGPRLVTPRRNRGVS